MRQTKKRDGVACYVKHELDCQFIAHKSFDVVDIFVCVSLEFGVSGQKYVIVSCIYRSPGSNINTFCEHLEQIFVELTTHNTVFLCGDYNIDILKHKSHQGITVFLDTMYSMGTYPLRRFGLGVGPSQVPVPVGIVG